MAKVNFAIVNVLWVLGAGCYLQVFFKSMKGYCAGKNLLINCFLFLFAGSLIERIDENCNGFMFLGKYLYIEDEMETKKNGALFFLAFR